MAFQQLPVTLRGTMLAGTAIPYSIKDRDTGQVQEGTSYRLFVLPEGQKPVEISVPQGDLALFNDADSLQFSEVEVDVRISPQEKRDRHGNIVSCELNVQALAVRAVEASSNGTQRPRRTPIKASA